MRHRFHVLGLAHTVTTPEYSSCAFTQKVVKLCRMLKSRGHTVIHYGNEDSRVACDEHVTVTKRFDLQKAYPGHNWRKQGWPDYKLDDHAYRTFYARTIAELHLRKQRGDFLLLPFGAGHKPVADAHPDMIHVESGIGYPGGCFARYKVFESYAIMQAFHGMPWVQSMSNDRWYDSVVIPNSFDLADFEFSADKDDYFLFLGRVNPGKGTHIALQIAEELGARLIVAGAGGFSGQEPRTQRPIADYVEIKGVVGPEDRKQLLARAKAVICASTFLEPFCGVQIEAMLSGTPVISTDFGAFAENNIHGVTGYRCRTFEQFVWAARNIHRIDPYACRSWAANNFALDRVAGQYEEFFSMVADIYRGKGWYEPHPERTGLDWLYKFPPDPCLAEREEGTGALERGPSASEPPVPRAGGRIGEQMGPQPSRKPQDEASAVGDRLSSGIGFSALHGLSTRS